MPIEHVAVAPVALGTLVWRDAANALRLTVIAKATFEAAPASSGAKAADARLVAPYPLFGDLYYEENDARSLRVASDFAPVKAAAEVLFTGAVYAPPGERVTHAQARLAVARGDVVLLDKRILAIGSRDRDKSGTPTPPQPFSVLPVRWELASGGAGSRANPVGMGEDPGDPRLPCLVDARNPKLPIGLGPIPPTWQARRELLGGADPQVFRVPVPVLRKGIDPAYFNAAPADQRTEAFRGAETVRMSGLHPAFAEVSWRLPKLRAHARLDLGTAARAVPLEADTLWIEGDLLRCTVTWRGSVAIEERELPALEGARVLATLAKTGQAPIFEPGGAAAVDAPSLLGGRTESEASRIFQRSASIDLELEHSMVFAPKTAKPLRVPRRVTPHVPVVNETGLQAWTIPWQAKPPEHSLTVVVKATFTLGGEGDPILAAEQDPPSGDVYEEPVGGAEVSSLRYASDFAVYKPAADVLLVGHAYSTDAASGVANVELRIGDLRRRLAVFGDRKWGGFGFEGNPRPFESMPLRWERALGGPLSDQNPVGRGYKTGVLVPNLERPEELVRTRDDRPVPACLAPVAPTWKARASKLGTYDRAWLKERWPYLPADFDWSYFNAAPSEQQVQYLQGDERYTLLGVLPGGRSLQGRLPGLKPRVLAQQTEEAGGSFFEVLLRLDTAWFDAEARKLVLLWRGLFATRDEDAPEIACLFVELEKGGAARSLEDLRSRCLARAATGLLPPAALAEPGDPKLEPGVRAAPLPPVAAPAMSAAQVLERVSSGASMAGVDLTGIDLTGADLSGADLSGAVLARARLERTKLDGAKLGGAVLSGALANGASFSGADLTAADLAGAQLRGAVLAKAVLERAVLDGAAADTADLRDARAARASLVGASLEDAKLDRADLSAADLTRSRIARASLRSARLEDVRLYEARGERAAFEGATMARARAEGASLPRANLARIDAASSVWEAADLTEASLRESKLPGAIFVRTKLDGASLDQATVTGASFRRASLRRARCAKANLMGAFLERADLTDADLRSANLYGAETWKAKMSGADLTLAHLAGTKLA